MYNPMKVPNKKNKTKYNDYKVSPVIRQGLQHWAYRLTPSDVK